MHDPARLSTAKDAVLLRSHDIIKSSTEVSRMSALDQRGPTVCLACVSAMITFGRKPLEATTPPPMAKNLDKNLPSHLTFT